MTPSAALAGTVGAAVYVGDARVGRIVGVYLDAACERAIGLEVANADGTRRFLPWVVASFENGHVRAASALHLLDARDGYERRGAVVLHDANEVDALSVTAEGRVVAGPKPVSEGLGAGMPSP